MGRLFLTQKNSAAKALQFTNGCFSEEGLIRFSSDRKGRRLRLKNQVEEFLRHLGLEAGLASA